MSDVIIKNTLTFYPNFKEANITLLRSFNRILEVLIAAKTREQFSFAIQFIDCKGFIYGTGGSHIWVKEESTGRQVLFKELD